MYAAWQQAGVNWRQTTLFIDDLYLKFRVRLRNGRDARHDRDHRKGPDPGEWQVFWGREEVLVHHIGTMEEGGTHGTLHRRNGGRPDFHY